MYTPSHTHSPHTPTHTPTQPIYSTPPSQVLEDMKLHFQEELTRKAAQREAISAMEAERQRYLHTACSPRGYLRTARSPRGYLRTARSPRGYLRTARSPRGYLRTARNSKGACAHTGRWWWLIGTITTSGILYMLRCRSSLLHVDRLICMYSKCIRVVLVTVMCPLNISISGCHFQFSTHNIIMSFASFMW